jgi:hypothetical protein
MPCRQLFLELEAVALTFAAHANIKVAKVDVVLYPPAFDRFSSHQTPLLVLSLFFLSLFIFFIFVAVVLYLAAFIFCLLCFSLSPRSKPLPVVELSPREWCVSLGVRGLCCWLSVLLTVCAVVCLWLCLGVCPRK